MADAPDQPPRSGPVSLLVHVVTHQLSATTPEFREFLESAFHFSVGVYDEERPRALPFPVIGMGAAR